jgi:hypothetical protein
MQADPQRIVFIDETGTSTKMTWLRGRYGRAGIPGVGGADAGPDT